MLELSYISEWFMVMSMFVFVIKIS